MKMVEIAGYTSANIDSIALFSLRLSRFSPRSLLLFVVFMQNDLFSV